MDARVEERPAAFPELAELETLIELGQRSARTLGFDARCITRVSAHGESLPVWAIALGNPDMHHAALGVFGGVHGLERIGASVVMAWLRTLLARASWDRALHDLLSHARIVLVPIVNPGGMALGTRANPRGVDLMRNAPVEADARVPWLMGGHRIGPRLPWFRGASQDAMEPEATALCALVEHDFAERPLSLAIDCHSGFGVLDRIWFPHARTRMPTRVLPEFAALTDLFERSHPHHPYRFEPQSAQYLAHGDLWDYLHARMDRPANPFLPMTLEMGSWAWVRKNLRQGFSREGIFNPRRAHRVHRVLRRHLPLFDFLLHATASHAAWMPHGAVRAKWNRDALARWYPEVPG